MTRADKGFAQNEPHRLAARTRAMVAGVSAPRVFPPAGGALGPGSSLTTRAILDFPLRRATLVVINQVNLIKRWFGLDECYSEIPRVRRGDLQLLPEGEASALAAYGKALGDPIRLQMVRLLEQREDLCTCEFEELLGLGQSKVSYHLKVLLKAGVVERELHGTWSHYSLRDPRLLERLGLLFSATHERNEALTA